MRFREIESDYESSYGETVLQTPLKCLEKSASELYTRSVFRLFRPVLERACRCKVKRDVQVGSNFTYLVYKYPIKDIKWKVVFCQDSLKFECSCKRFETMGIACEHVVSVLVDLNVVVVPECIVLDRWTKLAKDSINAVNANSSSQRNPAFITSYVTFLERCKRMVNDAFECGNPEIIRQTIDMVETQTELLEAIARGEDVDLSMMGTQTGGSVGNPPRVRRKGGITASSSKRLKEQNAAHQDVEFVEIRVTIANQYVVSVDNPICYHSLKL